MTKEQFEKMESDTIGISYITNISKKDVIHTFDGKPFGIKAKKTKPMSNYLAALLIKHYPESIKLENEEVEKEAEVPEIPDFPEEENIAKVMADERVKELEKKNSELLEKLSEKEAKKVKKIKNPQK